MRKLPILLGTGLMALAMMAIPATAQQPRPSREDIKQALAGDNDKATHTGDRYVTGDVNWDGYDLQALVGMVASPADPAQVDTVAGLWRTNGAAITQSAESLSK